MKTALRVGWRAGVGRGGAAVGADQRQGGGAWRGGWVPPGFRGLRRDAAPRPALHGSDEAMRPSFAEVPRRGGAGELGRGRGGRPRRGGPRRVAIRRLGAFPGSAEERRSGSDGPRAWGVADRRPAPSRAAGGGAAQALARRFPTPRRRRRPPPERLRGAPRGSQGRICGVWHGFGRAFESCPITQPYRTSPAHDKRGG